MLLAELLEARSHRRLNPKRSTNEIIKDAYERTTESIVGVQNLFVSLTALEKLGIYPGSSDNTPVGIYGYPAKYVVDKIGDEQSATHLPFAGDRPYFSLFKIKGNIINAMTIGEREVDEYYLRIVQHIRKLYTYKASNQVKAFIREAGAKAAHPEYAGGRLWYVTMRVADLIANQSGRSANIAWTSLMRAIGIDGVVDYDGAKGGSIIHPNEPAQMVVFSINAVSDVERYDNKYSPADVDRKIEYGAQRQTHAEEMYKKIRAAGSNPEDVYDLLKNDIGMSAIKFVRNQAIREYILGRSPMAIQYLAKPSLRDQEVVLRTSFKAIHSIRSLNQNLVASIFNEAPSDDKLRIIMNNLTSISEELQKAIVAYKPTMLAEFDPLSKAVAEVALANWHDKVGTLVPKWVRQLADEHNITI